jgi:type IV pilus assembly protein PilV
MARPGNDIHGFLLVEVLIAILVLTIGLVGLASMAATTINSNLYSKKRTTAITLARDKMEELKKMALSTPLSAADNSIEVNIDENGVAGNGIFTRQVTINGGPGVLTTITVTVTWSDYTNHTVTQTTLIRQ